MPAVSSDLSSERLIEMLRRMLRIRIFDTRAAELQAAGKLPGSIHTSIGHEAAEVGACMALRDDDYMTGYHRSHGHPIGKGARLGPLMAELLGRSEGICRGKGGSMHLADFSVGSLGESGIVGAGIPIAVGAGLSAKMQETDRVALCFFGDAAANSGPFHEGLNLAAIWRVPTIFVCENNRYGVTFSIEEAMAIEHVADRAAAYGMPGIQVDGQDILAVHSVVAEAVARARAGEGPTLIEAKTFRFRDHSELAPYADYRRDEEKAHWLSRDPISLFEQELTGRGTVTQDELQRLQDEVTAEVEEAIQFAQDSPAPELESAFEDVFVKPIPVRGVNR